MKYSRVGIGIANWLDVSSHSQPGRLHDQQITLTRLRNTGCGRYPLIVASRTFTATVNGRSLSARPGRVLGLAGTVFRQLGRAGPGRARF